MNIKAEEGCAVEVDYYVTTESDNGVVADIYVTLLRGGESSFEIAVVWDHGDEIETIMYIYVEIEAEYSDEEKYDELLKEFYKKYITDYGNGYVAQEPPGGWIDALTILKYVESDAKYNNSKGIVRTAESRVGKMEKYGRSFPRARTEPTRPCCLGA